MIRFNERFKELREYYGMNKSDFAKKLKIAPSTVSRYENGSMDIVISAINDIAEKLNISLAWLLGLDDNMYAVDVPYRKIPVLGQVKTLPVMDFGNFDGFEILKNEHKADFCIKIKDQGMVNANISPGDTLFFTKQEVAENGDIVAVLDDSNVLIRRYFKYGKQIVLKSEGAMKSENIIENVSIIGKAQFSLSEVE